MATVRDIMTIARDTIVAISSIGVEMLSSDDSLQFERLFADEFEDALQQDFGVKGSDLDTLDPNLALRPASNDVYIRMMSFVEGLQNGGIDVKAIIKEIESEVK